MGTTKSWMLFHALGVCGLALMSGREFYKRSIVSLRQQEQETLSEIGSLPERIETAQRRIAEIHAQGIRESAAGSDTARRLDGLPQGLPAPAVPGLVSDHFSRFGLDAPTVLKNSVQEAPGIPAYEISSWSVTVPVRKDARNIASVFRATEALDPQGSYLKVRDFALSPDPEDSTRQRATIHLSVLSKHAEAAR